MCGELTMEQEWGWCFWGEQEVWQCHVYLCALVDVGVSYHLGESIAYSLRLWFFVFLDDPCRGSLMFTDACSVVSGREWFHYIYDVR